MADTKPKKINPVIVGLGIVIIILTVLLTLALLGVFTPKPPPRVERKGRDLYTEKELGLYDTTVKCRRKYKNYPNSFGNDKLKYSKGCYTCPPEYTLYSIDGLDYPNNLPVCRKVKYQPAKPFRDENILGCPTVSPTKPVGVNDWLWHLAPSKETKPFDAIKPNACPYEDNYMHTAKALFIGSV